MINLDFRYLVPIIMFAILEFYLVRKLIRSSRKLRNNHIPDSQESKKQYNQNQSYDNNTNNQLSTHGNESIKRSGKYVNHK
jgi:hypothetical protein